MTNKPETQELSSINEELMDVELLDDGSYELLQHIDEHWYKSISGICFKNRFEAHLW